MPSIDESIRFENSRHILQVVTVIFVVVVAVVGVVVVVLFLFLVSDSFF